MILTQYAWNGVRYLELRYAATVEQDDIKKKYYLILTEKTKIT